MSNTDSFIEEVTEEVRRDRLFLLLKRWGWVAGLAVLLIVGGAAYNEWSKANEAAKAQAFGDALLAGIEADDAGVSLATVNTESGAQAAVVGHLAAADALASGESETAAQAWQGVQSAADAPELYKALAAFKSALALSPDVPAEDRLAAFNALSGPGAPFAVLAEEQRALILIETGKTEEALSLLNGLLERANVTPGLQRRASELIVALGGTPGEG